MDLVNLLARPIDLVPILFGTGVRTPEIDPTAGDNQDSDSGVLAFEQGRNYAGFPVSVSLAQAS